MNLSDVRGRLKGLPLGSYVLPFSRRADLADAAGRTFSGEPSLWRDRSPIRDALLSPETLEEHARSLARAQAVTANAPRRYGLTRRVADNAKALREAYRRLSIAAGAREAVSPAAEWIIDNYHIVERQIRDIRVDLPPGYYRRLPMLASGPFRGYPRILGAAWTYVAHTDSHFSPDVLCRFFHAYQEMQPLTIGELWAVPITLRILLVENLRRFAELSLLARDARALADSTAARILLAAAEGPKHLAKILSELKRVPLPGAFVVHLAQRLRDQDPGVAPALIWLDQRLALEETSIDETVRVEQQREINATVTVRNIITSMRLTSDVDWRDLFERMSLVDDVLKTAPGYSNMDFATRDLYRAGIEQIARGSRHTEVDVAQSAVATAAAAHRQPSIAGYRTSDPGYYLIAEGRRPFERALEYSAPIETWPGRITKGLGIGGYVAAGSLASVTLLALAIASVAAQGVDVRFLWALAALGALPAIDAAVSIVNHLITRGLKATLLPGVELPDGVPDHMRTLLVVPTMLTSPTEIEEHVERLEVHFLSCPKGEIYFALLTDWTDAETEHVKGDEELLATASRAIARLNSKYAADGCAARFLLLHRKRVWTASEAKWIGWERKRGKLSELNELLAGATATTFIGVSGRPPSVPKEVRYVITLDADTRITPDAVTRLIGKMAHPLNTPHLDPETRRVSEGYAILQPRVTPSMPAGQDETPFLRIFSSSTGIDPYAAAASDVYQDLLGEGSYTGKGIYDVAAFRGALAGRVAPSSLLSHDLFEGAFARSGLASDIEFVETFPARYDAAAMRHHRWARGDWQLLPWILGLQRTPGPRGPQTGAPISGRWKMLDNLRRSMSAPAAACALLAGFALPVDASLLWTAFVLATMAAAPLIPLIGSIAPRSRDNLFRFHLRMIGSDFRLAVEQWFLATAFLAHQAWLMGDAAIRTLVRLGRRKNLLEWTPAAKALLGDRPTLSSYYRYMAGALVLAAAALLIGPLFGNEVTPLAIAFALLWGVSPALAVWASKPPPPRKAHLLAPADAAALRLIARRTWRYFETFVTSTHNFLPPDNFQESPAPIVAHRTSPTNIGLYLLSVVSAHELGWIDAIGTVERLEATYATLHKLERFRGHLYNWYDTHDLRALDPRYISSVDSGNLAGHLIALAQACRTWSVRPQTLGAPCFDADALAIAREEARALRGKSGAPLIQWPQIEQEIESLERTLRALPCDGDDVRNRLKDLAARTDGLIDALEAHALNDGDDSAELRFWLAAAARSLSNHATQLDPDATANLGARLETLAHDFRDLALSMDFSFLLDRERLLLSIGYRGTDGVLDPSCYDLLASEARLASLLAIAKGDAPNKHWFRLSHAVVPLARGPALVSWSGSMFEYLMPSLVMQEPTHSVLERTNRLIVNRQIEYGRKLKTPWGVSESAYNARDLDFTYQYSNFGVPGLGLKRGLADNIVVSPYATALAAMVAPTAAVRNFERLAQLGARGRYGFYEAIDFTPERLQSGERAAIVQCFMAHHQGMTITALANVICNGLLRRHFHAEPIIQASELLLQERMPRDVQAPPAFATVHRQATEFEQMEPVPQQRTANPWSASPATHLLSNGRYTVMLTAAGSGYSAWRNLAITRWREDSTRDDWGSYFYVRDAKTGECLSPTLQPICHRLHAHRATFDEEKAAFTCEANGIAATMEVIVSEEDDAEVRRVSVKNSGREARDLEITSFAELALAPPAADLAHPAFSKLFIEVEHLPRAGALLARRRRRAPDEPDVWAAHLAVVEGTAVGLREFETSRARFVGRSRDVHEPIAALSGSPLAGTIGATLDPIFSLRRRVRVESGETARIHYWTIAAGSRREALDLIDKHNDVAAYERAATLAWTQSQVELHHIGIDRDTAALYQRLAGHLIYATPAMRPSSDTIRSGRGEQSLLWSLGVSGDLPILLVRVSETQELRLVEEALQAFEYFRAKRLPLDLVFLNERDASYQQDLQDALESAVRASQARPHIGAEPPAGNIYVLRADLITTEARGLLSSVARVILHGERGRLGDQLRRRPETEHFGLRARRNTSVSALQPPGLAPNLDYFNGLGGFAKDGKEYVITLAPGQNTPAPWINVVANAAFGFQTSESGAGFTWSRSSREHQITPWSNDPVSDSPGQAFFIRDRDTGALCSPTAAPVRSAEATYVVRHGRGYSRFECDALDLALALTEYVPLSDPIKISRLTITNTSSVARRLSVTAYVEWVLGPSRSSTAPLVTTELCARTGSILAANCWNPAFKHRVAFADFRGRQASWTGDRREFIGRNGSLSNPAALAHDAPLSGRLGAGLDPCAALQTSLDLGPDESTELVFLLGDAASEQQAIALIERYRDINLDDVLNDVRAFWYDLLGAVQVKTPDRSFDIMVNGWLLYQTLACRIWARSGFYQASGAYGFRDQLQDVMALTAQRPQIARDQILRAAARQFPEGDVQHWWLPQTGQGVRTRISDDRVWLAHATAYYVRVTGDNAVLEEQIRFLDGPLLENEESEAFFRPQPSKEIGSLYEHCARALDASLAVGSHGAPLIGGGDWNDGMNRVGAAGRGESVWLGWFLHTALSDFAPIADQHGDAPRAAIWRAHANALSASLHRTAWDGDWYRRGWYDDGAPLGSASSEECRIDSIAQSWAVLSGAADEERARRAMAAVERDLIRPQDGLALLFAPPFDRTSRDPGYIKGYPPGVRENGGQYTHGAVWSVMAFAALGDGDKASALFWMLNPINHARTRADVHRYKVEPYVMAADVYSAQNLVGRGGWTWYTGSAGLMHRAALENILGLRVEGAHFRVEPCIPRSWPEFQLSLRFGSTCYDVFVVNPDGLSSGVASAALDGTRLTGAPLLIPIIRDGKDHRVDIVLGLS